MLTNKQTVTNLANLIFNLNLRFKKATMLYENVAKNLANLFGANNLVSIIKANMHFFESIIDNN